MKSQTPLARSEKYLFATSLILVALILSGAWYWNTLEAEPNWNIPAPPVAPNPNGFDLYVAAAKAVIPAKPPVDQVNDPTFVEDPKLFAQKYSLAKRQAWLKENAAVFSLFQRALKTPALYPQTDSPNTFPDVARLRELARDKIVELHAREMAGDWDGAMQSGIDTVQMGHDIRRGAPLVGWLLGVGVGAIGRGDLYDTPEKMSAAAAKKGARRLEDLFNRRVSITQALRNDRAYSLRLLRAAMKKSDWRDIGELSTLAEKLELRTTSKRRVVAEYERGMKVIIANSALPYKTPARPRPKSGLLADALLADSDRYLLPDSDRYRFMDARDQAGDIILMLRLALQAFRLERGHHPAQLNELTPTYLKTIPADPFSNAPLGYKKTGQTYLLWSIGPDGKDDKGKPIPRKSKPRLIPGIPITPPPLLQDSQGDYVAGKNR